GQIPIDTFRIYRKGFLQFLGLALLIAIPSLCAQLPGSTFGPSPNMEANLRTLTVAAFSFCMFLVSLAVWPVFIAGIQILTTELAGGRSVKMLPLLQNALKFWPRIAMLCIFVYGTYLFWTVLPIGIILMVMVAGPSVILFFLSLVVLAFKVWIVGRLFVIFLFWLTFVVLDGVFVGCVLLLSIVIAL